ncbi:MAG: class I SAM-dependent methyltransferase [Pseudomonadota bacterium]
MTATVTNLSRVGANRHPLKARGNDLYETPDCATETLCRELGLPKKIWEPACGRGAIAKILLKHGHSVACTDLVDYGYGEAGVDFLMEHDVPNGVRIVVTNPPFKLANEFVRHALSLVPRCVMLLRLAYLEGAGRSDIIDGHLSELLVGIERLPMMHRDGWYGPKKSNAAQPFAWFVFDRDLPENHQKTFRRVSWRQAA